MQSKKSTSGIFFELSSKGNKKAATQYSERRLESLI
jgi:hypothetical protein